jgi:hypothetical protein
MTARQIIQEIEALAPEEQLEVLVSIQERLNGEPASRASVIRYLDPEKAESLTKEILKEHAELFQKLAR